jgi:hypothetical protein
MCSGRCIEPETRAFFAAILSFYVSQSIVSRVAIYLWQRLLLSVGTLLALKLSRCM